MRSVPAILARRPRLPIGLAAVLGVALLAGCGGGGGDDDPSEDALRSRLAAAFDKTDDARSIRTLDSFEVEGLEDGESGSFCLDIVIDKGRGDGAESESFVIVSRLDGCKTGSVTGEIVLVGNSIWVSSGNGSFRPGTIDTKLIPDLTDEGLDFGDLPGIATDIGLGDEPTGESAKGAGPTYEFEAPASALSDEIDADSTELDFTATTDSRGYLTGLTVEVEVSDTTARVVQAYSEINGVQPIEGPPKQYVHGRPVRVKTKSDLERLTSSIVPEAL